MKHLLTFSLLLTVGIAIPARVLAEPNASANAESSPKAHGGHGHGPMSGDFRGVIHSLFTAHDQVDRVVEETENGYRARTTSKDLKVAAMLQKHVAQMESRLEGGAGVRHWDPAFVELREHYENMTVEVETIDGGVAVSLIGKTPEAVKVARNHAAIISGFVDKGEEQMHATHGAVLAGNDQASAAPKAEGCKECGGKGVKASCESCKKEKPSCPCELEGKESAPGQPES